MTWRERGGRGDDTTAAFHSSLLQPCPDHHGNQPCCRSRDNRKEDGGVKPPPISRFSVHFRYDGPQSPVRQVSLADDACRSLPRRERGDNAHSLAPGACSFADRMGAYAPICAGSHNRGGMEISSPSVTPMPAAVTMRTKKAARTAHHESFGSIPARYHSAADNYLIGRPACLRQGGTWDGGACGSAPLTLRPRPRTKPAAAGLSPRGSAAMPRPPASCGS